MDKFLKFLRALVARLVGRKRYKKRFRFLPRWDRADWRRIKPVEKLLIPFRNGRDPTEHFFLVVFRVVFALFLISLTCAVATHALPGVELWFPYRGLFPDDKPGGWDDIRSLAFAVAGVVGAVFGLFQLQNSATRTRLSGEETRVKQEQERNERFVSSVKLLSDDDPSVRMGGVFALERLALEQDAKYTQTVIEVLSGFVRERTNRSGEIEGERAYPAAPRGEKPAFAAQNSETEDGEPSDLDAYKKALRSWLDQQIPPTEPIAAAVKSLALIWRDEQNNKKAPGINFEKAVLTKLPAAKLTKLAAANFDLKRCNFRMARLEGADLFEARLEGADLSLGPP